MTTERRRAVEVMESVLARIDMPPIVMNDWVRHQFDGEKMTVTAIPREQVYFDTTQAGPQLAEYTAKAGEQNAEVLAIYHRMRRPLSPSEVWSAYPAKLAPGMNLAARAPLTSIRRAITTLTQAGALVKTETKRKGIYGRSEYEWRLSDGQ